jgi:hypothetical protein
VETVESFVSCEVKGDQLVMQALINAITIDLFIYRFR